MGHLNRAASVPGVFELMGINPTRCRPAAVAQAQGDNLGASWGAIGHGKGATFPPQQSPLAAFLNGLRERGVGLLPFIQRTGGNADGRGGGLCRQAVRHGGDHQVTVLGAVVCGPAAGVLGLRGRGRGGDCLGHEVIIPNPSRGLNRIRRRGGVVGASGGW